jgi:hypothetical protein
MRYNSGLIASMEEIDNEPITDEVEAAEVAATVADESAEIQTDGDEIGTSVAEVEDAVQGGEELEAIGEVAVDAVESGEGLSEDAAEVASIAIESIRNRLGFRADTRLVPATESFGNSNTRLMSTRLVVEGVMDSIKKIWAAIKAAVLRVWDKIKSFTAKLFNSSSMLGKHVEALRARARDLPSNAKMKEKKISSGIAGQINDGKTANMASLKKISDNTLALVGASSDMSEAQKTVSVEAQTLASGEINQDSVKKFLAAQSSASSKILAALSKINPANGLAAQASTRGPKAAKGSKTVTKAFGPFVGNTLLVVDENESEFLGAKVSRVSLSFQAPKGKAADKVEALTSGEIQEVLGMANKMVLVLQDFKKVQGNYDTITKATTKLADTVMSNAQKILNKTGSDSETRQGLQELKTEVNAGIAAMNAFGSRAPALVFQLVKAMADYASISMRNLEAV